MRHFVTVVLILVLFCIGNIPSNAQDIPGPTLSMSAGTMIRLVLAEELNSQRNRVGDEVIFTLAEDLVINERTYLVEGTPVLGTVTSVRPSRSWGRQGNIEIEISSISPLYSDPIPLTGEAKDTGETNSPYSAGAVILIGITPVGLLAGSVIEGHDAVIDEGMEFTVFTAEDGEVMDISAYQMRQFVDEWLYNKVMESFLEYSWDDKNTIRETFDLLGYTTDPWVYSIYEIEDNYWSVNAEVVPGTHAVFAFKPFEEPHLGKFRTIDGENELGDLIIWIIEYEEDNGNDFDLPF